MNPKEQNKTLNENQVRKISDDKKNLPQTAQVPKKLSEDKTNISNQKKSNHENKQVTTPTINKQERKVSVDKKEQSTSIKPVQQEKKSKEIKNKIENESDDNIELDNDSNDGSCEIIENKFKKFNIKFIKNKNNRGFAGGNNDAIPYLSGDYVLLLNNDTEVPREFLENFIGAFKKNTRIGVAQPKILQIENKKLFDRLYHYCSIFSIY